MRLQQNDICAICGSNFKSEKDCYIDHNHEIGEICELSCNNCNMLLGLVKENTKVLAKAIDYLNKHQSVIPSN